jgi:hypothetical protein
MKYIPKKYQGLITSFEMNNPRCCIFASMGSGKTVSTLTGIEAEYMCGASRPTLVLAPVRVCKSVWPQEAQKWDHLHNCEVTPITGSAKEKRIAIKKDTSIHAVNYESLQWLVEHWGKDWPYYHIVADESTKLKSFRTRQGGKRARALASVAHTRVKRFTNLTGTPSPNGLQDLWGQLWFVDKGERLGKSYKAFTDRWFTQNYSGFGHTIAGDYAPDEIYDRLRDVCLTVDVADYMDIRKPIVNNVYAYMPNQAAKVYKEMEDELIIELRNHTITAANAAVKTQKLLQLANGAIYRDRSVEDDNDPRSRIYEVVHDAKLDALDSVINESGGEPILIAYHFNSDKERIMRAFKQVKLYSDENEVLWNKGRIAAMLVHPASAGHGLNLQFGGRRIVFYAHNWSLENRLQVIERIGPTRQKQAGFDRAVYITNILTANTVDQMVLDRVDDKKSVQDTLMEQFKIV